MTKLGVKQSSSLFGPSSFLENPLIRPRVGGFAGHRPARYGPAEREGRCPLG